MNVRNLFAKFKDNWYRLKDLDEESKEDYLNSLINRVNINNPHYIKDLPDFYFYNLVKEKCNIFFDEIGFECKRCLNSCCYFFELDSKTQEIGIQLYKEDYKLLKNSNEDLNGYIINEKINNKLIVNHLFPNPFNYSANRDILDNLGYASIGVIEKQNKSQCYYFDEKRKECKIHKYKPLTCHTYPFRFMKRSKGIDILIFDYCIFIKQKIEENKDKRFFTEKCIKLYSYWEFWIALSLFLK